MKGQSLLARSRATTGLGHKRLPLAVVAAGHAHRRKKHLRITAHRMRHRLHRVGRVNHGRRLGLSKVRTYEA